MTEGPPGPIPEELKQEGEITPEIQEWTGKIIQELDENWENHLTMAVESGQETPSIVNLMEAVGDERLFSDLSTAEKTALADALKQNDLVSRGQVEVVTEENDIVFKPKPEQEIIESVERKETITFKTECIYCGNEITHTQEVQIPENPKIKKPKKGKPYHDIDCPTQVPCLKGCKHPDAVHPTLYTLYERRYIE